MTLRCHFMLNSVFIVGFTRFFCLAFVDNCVKMNEDTPILLATKMFAIDGSFWRYIVCGYSLQFLREEASVNHGLVESDQFSMPLVALSSEPLKIRPKLL